MIELITSMLKDASILVSLFTLVGNLIQRKPINELIISVVKTLIGFSLLLLSAKALVSPALKEFSKLFMAGFGVQGIVPNNEVIIVSAMKQIGPDFASAIAFALIGAMIFNLILAKITPLKYVMLSGHHVFFMVSALTLISMLHGFSLPISATIAALITGLWCVISPSLLVGYCRQIKNVEELRQGGDFSIGQFGSTSYMISGFLGSILGNKNNDIEKLKIPTSIGFLQNKQVSMFVVMLIFFIASAVFAGSEKTQVLADATGSHGAHINIGMYLIAQTVKFTAGVYALTQGVHMFVGELIPAFKGISNKLIKKSIPAIEIYALFPYSTNAVFVGFLVCTISAFITMLILPYCGLPVIVPSLLFTFASGGGAGIVGNATGGIRGTIIGSAVCGIISIFGSAFIFQPIHDAGVTDPTTYSTTDFTLLAEILHHILGLFT